MSYGKSSEQKNIQNEIQSVMGNVINVTGNDNQVTINSVKDLVDEYQRLQSQNKSLLEQNSKYFSDLTEANYQVSTLQSKSDDMPDINFNNLSLFIDAQDIPINKNNSMVTIDGRDYFSREIVESLIPDNQNFTIKDNTLFIGKVIAEKANLFDQWKVDSYWCDIYDTATDSYGNVHSNVLVFTLSEGSSTYKLDGKYSQLKLTMSITNKSNGDASGTVIIKADDNVVYTSPTLGKKTELLTVDSILIDNCTLLTIKYNANHNASDCIISDAIVYN